MDKSLTPGATQRKKGEDPPKTADGGPGSRWGSKTEEQDSVFP